MEANSKASFHIRMICASSKVAHYECKFENFSYLQCKFHSINQICMNFYQNAILAHEFANYLMTHIGTNTYASQHTLQVHDSSLLVQSYWYFVLFEFILFTIY